MERRRYPRLSFAAKVEIRPLTGAQELISTTTHDICTTGLLVHDVPLLSPGTLCELAIHLSSGEMDLPIRARGEVVRQVCDERTGSDRDVGIRFLEMDDDSQALLWNVIRYNRLPPEEETEPEGPRSPEETEER